METSGAFTISLIFALFAQEQNFLRCLDDYRVSISSLQANNQELMKGLPGSLMLGRRAASALVVYVAKNESEGMAAKFGVIIRSAKSTKAIFDACNNLLQGTKSGGIITTVSNDETYGGVKVYFNSEGVVQELLDKQFLGETGDDLCMYPLLTYLTVHEAVFPMSEEEKFVQELQKVLKDALGTAVQVSKIPFDEKYPSIGSGNWRVLVEFPEIEDLDVYKRNGLPDNFTIEVPGMHETLSVTFNCTRCAKDGHTQRRCPERIAIEAKPDLLSVKEKESSVEIAGGSGSGDREREAENKEGDTSRKNNPLLNLKSIREFESEIGKEQVLSFHLMDSNCIKKEPRELIFPNPNSIATGSHSSADDATNEPLSKNARLSHTNGNDGRTENVSKASSTTNDEELVEIVFESVHPVSKERDNFPSSSVGGTLTTTKNAADDSVSTSNQPAPAVKSEIPYDSDSSQGPSASVSQPGRQRKKPTQPSSIVIPDRIKTIISKIEDRVLEVDALEAFLTHVKKKSRPREVAKIFTDNVDALKLQLENIRKGFYNTALRPSKEEGPFMKWFNSTLDRFDGTPSTRKRKSTASAVASN